MSKLLNILVTESVTIVPDNTTLKHAMNTGQDWDNNRAELELISAVC